MNKSVMGMLVGFAALAGCASSGAAEHRGSMVVVPDSVKAFAEGPAVVHAFSMDSGGRVFVTAKKSGTDADCVAAMASAANASTVVVDQRNVVTLTAGQIACVATNGPRDYELIWHARPAQAPGGTFLVAQTKR